MADAKDRGASFLDEMARNIVQGPWEYDPAAEPTEDERMALLDSEMAEEAGPGRQQFSAPEITADELATARLTPDCIVKGLYYADVGLLVAPGGVGKTTLMLWIACHVVLGREVFGCPVDRPGPVVFVTAEDPREIMVARLRMVIAGMQLDAADADTVLRGIRIADVSGHGYKLTMVAHDIVIPSGNVDEVIASCQEILPAMVIIDPAVSFGVGEFRVNDAEQGLIEAARRMRNALNCAVIYVHHTGKANAREKTLDQYSGRNGSSFADGSRMVHVLQNMDSAEWAKATGEPLKHGETGIVLARPKMSYCPPVGDLFIRRRGYMFEVISAAIKLAPGDRLESDANQVHQFLLYEFAQGRMHTLRTVQDAEISGVSRDRKRSALSRLESDGRAFEDKRPGVIHRGSRTFLRPVGSTEEGMADFD